MKAAIARFSSAQFQGLQSQVAAQGEQLTAATRTADLALDTGKAADAKADKAQATADGADKKADANTAQIAALHLKFNELQQQQSHGPMCVCESLAKGAWGLGLLSCMALTCTDRRCGAQSWS